MTLNKSKNVARLVVFAFTLASLTVFSGACSLRRIGADALSAFINGDATDLLGQLLAAAT